MPRALEAIVGILVISFFLWSVYNIVKDFFKFSITPKSERPRGFTTLTPSTESEVEEMISTLNKKLADAEIEAKKGVAFAKQKVQYYQEELNRIEELKGKIVINP